MRLYRALNRLFPRSYSAKLFFAAFIGTHVPLIALVMWMLLREGSHDPLLTRAALVALLATLVGTALAFWLLHRLLLPVRMAARALDDYERDQSLPEFRLDGDDDAAILLRGVHRNLRRIDADRRELEGMLVRDALTGALNRRGCEQRLAQSVSDARRNGTPFTLVVADMDDLKQINDAQGHAAGDQALVELVQAALMHLDTGDWIGRWGGDEFLIGMHVDIEQAEPIVQAWIDALTQFPQPMRASVGITGWVATDSAQDVYRKADAAMYAAKFGGGQRIMRAPSPGST